MEIRIEVNSNDILNSVTGLCVKFAHTNTHTHTQFEIPYRSKLWSVCVCKHSSISF